MAKSPVKQKRAPQASVKQKRAPKASPKHKKTDSNASAEQTADPKAARAQAPPDAKASERQTPDAKASEKQTPEPKASEKQTPDIKVAEKKAPEAKEPEKKTPEAKAGQAPEEKADQAPESEAPADRVPGAGAVAAQKSEPEMSAKQAPDAQALQVPDEKLSVEQASDAKESAQQKPDPDASVRQKPDPDASVQKEPDPEASQKPAPEASAQQASEPAPSAKQASAQQGSGTQTSEKQTADAQSAGPKSSAKKKSVTLALQGGGSHGAFTWGVLDRLLEDDRIEIEGISGTSAGAMNAVVLAHGFEINGPEGARKELHDFWRAISKKGEFSPYHSGFFNPLQVEWSPLAWWLDLLSQTFSPYQLNPFDYNPLRDTLRDTINFKQLRTCGRIRLFISATNVNTNHLHVFTNSEISLDVLMASACLPYLHHAVQINGDCYWDGGFMGNPALEPLIRQCKADDTIIVQVNPTDKGGVPRLAVDIADRLNEITFNSNLMREIRSYVDVTRMIESGHISDPRIERAYFHIIPLGWEMNRLGVRSKLDTSWTLLKRLFSVGRRQADTWLAQNFDDIGKRSTLDLEAWSPTENRAMSNRG
jgi:NTE family protein